LTIYFWGFAILGFFAVISALYLYSKKYNDKLRRKQFAIKCLGLSADSPELNKIIKNPEFWEMAEEIYTDIIMRIIDPQSGDFFAYSVIQKMASRKLYNAKKGEYPDEKDDSPISEKMIVKNTDTSKIEKMLLNIQETHESEESE